MELIDSLQQTNDLEPSKYDASYELVHEVINSYSKMDNLSDCDYHDLDLVYLSTIGTWKHSIDKKKESIEKSHLTNSEKNRLTELLDSLWEKAKKHEYQNIESIHGISIGMFGTGFYTTQTKTNPTDVQKFINICIRILDENDEEKLFEIVEEGLKEGIRGLATGGISQVLHCLKPTIFPILNNLTLDSNLFQKLGVILQKPGQETNYIDNCRRIKTYRDSNFTWKNYRIFDLEASKLNNKNFWLLTWNEENWNWENYDEQCIGTKQGKSYTESWTCKSKQPALGDHIFLLKTGNGAKGILAHGQIVKTSYEAPHYDTQKASEGKTTSHVDVEFDRIQNYKNEPILDLQTLKSNFPEQDWSPQGSGIQIKCDTTELLRIWNETQGESEMSKAEELAKLLKNTHNLILHGAPGTGKTHLARDIAEVMNAEVGFVQFHPSYDYTDFVEGLRPINDGTNTQLIFERKDGVFKKFCKRAVEKLDNCLDCKSELHEKVLDKTVINESITDEFDKIYNEICTEVKNGKTKVGIEQYKSDVSINDKGSIVFGSDKRSENKNNMKLLYKYFSDNNCWNEAKNNDRTGFWHPLISRLTGGQTKTIDYKYYQSILLEMNFRRKANVQIEDGKKSETNEKFENHNNPFLFIIDEINRGEMSKIFGELFFSIDPDYRGKDGLIQTQYQNLVPEGDTFSEGFFIPENVYIIGTMNDIDRNVESMDFAFRRRFTFMEITAKDTQQQILAELDDSIRDEAIVCMNSLNNAISKIEGLSSAYHIGGAYFLKLKELDNDFKLLWDYHLQGLLREYLRGMEDSESKLEDLKKAYNQEA